MNSVDITPRWHVLRSSSIEINQHYNLPSESVPNCAQPGRCVISHQEVDLLLFLDLWTCRLAKALTRKFPSLTN